MKMLSSILKASVEAFSNHNGNISTMRITSFLVCAAIMGLWVTFCFIEGRYIPLGWAEAGIIGAACGAKAAQSRFEIGSQGLGGFDPLSGGDVGGGYTPGPSIGEGN